MHETGLASNAAHKEARMQYDYIIVGAGSGGCSLASRLADSCPDATIALIEAGPHAAEAPLPMIRFLSLIHI